MKIARLNQMTMMIAVGFLLISCSQITYSPTASSDLGTHTPAPTSTQVPSETPAPERMLLPIDAAYQIVQNNSFSSGTSHWKQRDGKFTHSASQYYTEPGGGLIITNGLDNVGVAGQCVSVQNHLTNWPTIEDQKRITFDTYLKTDINIYQVTLLIIFHQEECDRPGQLHTQVGTMQSGPILGDQNWTHISTAGIIPDDALSVDILIWALGKNNTARVYFDDVKSYPSTFE